MEDPRTPSAEAAPLEGEGGLRHVPAVALAADQVLGRHDGVRHEDLVERLVAVHLPERTGLDPRLTHVEQEVADPLVLRHVPVAARDEQPEVRVVRARVPDLLAVDDPLPVLHLGPGAQAGQVRAAARLAEELAPCVFAGQDGPEKAPLLVVRPAGQDRFRGQTPGSYLRGRHRVLLPEDLGDDRGLVEREAAAVPLLGPVRRRPAAFEQDLPPLDQGTVGPPVRVEPGRDLLADPVRSHAAPSSIVIIRSRWIAGVPNSTSEPFARLNHRWVSFSQVKPIPPRNWMPALAALM